jgi:uncharacterized protein DUF2188
MSKDSNAKKALKITPTKMVEGVARGAKSVTGKARKVTTNVVERTGGRYGKVTIKSKVTTGRFVPANSRGKKGMVKGTVQHVIPLGNGWMVKGADSHVITLVTDNKQQAIMIATAIAKNNGSQLKIHNQSGQAVELHTFIDGKKVKKKLEVAEK